MASLNRAYGIRGAAIALGMAAVAGCVHGVLAATFDHLAAKLALGMAGAVLMVMGGAVSARQSLAGALGVGFAMGLLFFWIRWAAWALMTGGIAATASFAATPPWGWPSWLAASGIGAAWTVEAVSLLIPALFGCLVGQERRHAPA